MAPKKVTLKEFFQSKGYKEIPSESELKRKKGTTLNDLKIRQQRVEGAMSKAMNADKASYKGRANSGLKGPGPNYQGPMDFAGRGTKDKMPGTTPNKKKKRVNEADA